MAAASPQPLVRAHDAWAARRLGLDAVVEHLASDPDPEVAAEMVAAVPRREDLR
ncbi:MAG: hypothetical protein JJE52_16015 [Acidimicrobiia bacterium]|nr:hypothetical protein [Acidimicrobiia bacterium]